ncbi:hypothetical protein Tco_0597755 [Tanacetum coccineum]
MAQDMNVIVSNLKQEELGALIKNYRILLYLHPRLPPSDLCISQLLNDSIGICSWILEFFRVRIPFFSFLLSVLKYFKVHLSQLVPLGLNKVVTFEIICRDLDINLTVNLFRVFQILCKQGDWFSFAKRRDDFPTDGFNLADVEKLCGQCAKLHDVPEVVLICFGLSTFWLNRKCEPVFRKNDNTIMSIYDFMTIPSWSEAKVVEEQHGLAGSILELFDCLRQKLFYLGKSS